MNFFNKIDDRFIELMKRFRLALSDFDAARCAWSTKFARPNRKEHEEFIKDMETMQGIAVVNILSIAEQIRDHTDTKWMTSLGEDVAAGSDGFYIATTLGSIQVFQVEGRKVVESSAALPNPDPVKYVNLLVDAGWQVEGPIRCPRLS